MSRAKPKVGQIVYVVPQKQRHGSPTSPYETPIVKVGRKFAYIERYGTDAPFRLDSWTSHHGDNTNDRANGFGFDVYESKEEYDRKVLIEGEFSRLRLRIMESRGWGMELKKFPPHIVAKLHDVLDEFDWEQSAECPAS